LEAVQRGVKEEHLMGLATREPSGLDSIEIITKTGWSESEMREVVRRLVEANRIRLVSSPKADFVIGVEQMANLIDILERQVGDFHKRNPLLQGISKEELRCRTGKNVRPEVFRAALDELVSRGKVTVARNVVEQVAREITLSIEEAKAKNQIVGEFERAGLAVPALADVIGKLNLDARRAWELIQMLLREKILVKVTEDFLIHQETLKELQRQVARYKEEMGERLPIAAFKQITGVSRKYAIPLLEYLDREHLTRRIGDDRFIV
jgi:selenocysteine-specific elongation factor